MSRAPRTVVEFSDTAIGDDPICHKTREILINGVPVCVAKDGIDFEFGDGEITSVTLKLLPTEVHFNHKAS